MARRRRAWHACRAPLSFPQLDPLQARKLLYDLLGAVARERDGQLGHVALTFAADDKALTVLGMPDARARLELGVCSLLAILLLELLASLPEKLSNTGYIVIGTALIVARSFLR